jgi:hypothetical protein
MNRKSDEFREFGPKNQVERSSGSKDMGFESLRGQNGLFRWFWSNSGFLERLEGRCVKDRAPAEFRKFSGIFVDFLECLEWFRTYL